MKGILNHEWNSNNSFYSFSVNMLLSSLFDIFQSMQICIREHCHWEIGTHSFALSSSSLFCHLWIENCYFAVAPLSLTRPPPPLHSMSIFMIIWAEEETKRAEAERYILKNELCEKISSSAHSPSSLSIARSFYLFPNFHHMHIHAIIWKCFKNRFLFPCVSLTHSLCFFLILKRRSLLCRAERMGVCVWVCTVFCAFSQEGYVSEQYLENEAT